MNTPIKKITEEDLKIIQDNLSELELLIQKYVGNITLNLSAALSINKYNQKNYISIISEDLIESIPVFKTMFVVYNITLSSAIMKSEDNSICFKSICNYDLGNHGSNSCGFIWETIQFKDGKWVEGSYLENLKLNKS